MGELTLVGLTDDGAGIVFAGPDGTRFRVVIDEALRAAVRRDRPGLEQLRSEQEGPSPREIQSRIRAGASAAEVAEEAGIALDLVVRYEGAVVAEREFVADQARACRIGRDADAPVLGDLVADRLATRDVDPDDITWDAYRTDGPWTVEVRFRVGEAERSARWSFVPATRTLKARDDEARWLSETRIEDEPIPRRHLAAVRDDVFDAEVDAVLRPLLASVDEAPGAGTGTGTDETAALLDDLADLRGVRRPVEDDEPDDEFEGFGPQHAFDFSLPAHPPASRPDLATDATVLSLRPGPAGEPVAGTTEARDVGADAPADVEDIRPAGAPERPRSRKGRASVPSWDEIVFGARND